MTLDDAIARYDSGADDLAALEQAIEGRARELVVDIETDFNEAQKATHKATQSLFKALLTEESAVRVRALGRLAARAAEAYWFEDVHVALAHHHCAIRLYELEQYDLAAEEFRRAMVAFSGPHDSDDAEVYHSAALRRLTCLRERDLHAEVERDATAYLDGPASIPDAARAVALARRGDARYELGRPAEAVADVREAIRIREGLAAGAALAAELPRPWVWSLRLGLAARATGAFDEAMQAFERGRELALAAAAGAPAAMFLREIGLTWFMLGEEERARQLYGLAAAEARRLGLTDEAWRWGGGGAPEPDDRLDGLNSYYQAVWLFEQQPVDYDRIHALIARATKDATERDEPVLEFMARNLRGAVHRQQGKHWLALTAFEAAYAAACRLSDPLPRIGVGSNLARALGAVGRGEDAVRQLREVIALGEPLRAGSSSEFRKALGAGLADAYECLAFVLSHLPDTADELLTLSQRFRGVNLATGLALDEAARAARGGLPAAVRAVRQAQVDVEAAASASGIGLTTRLAELARCERELRSVGAAAGRELGPPPVFARADLAAALDPGEVLVDLFALESSVIATAVVAGGAPTTVRVEWARDDRLDLIRRWQAAAHGDPPAAMGALVTEFRERLLAPLAELVRASGPAPRVLLCPQCELSHLPFALLEDDVAGAVVSIALAPAVFALLRRRPPPVDGVRMLIGDATGSLLHSRADIDAPDLVRARFDLGAVVTLAAGARTIHFAGHGVFNPDDPYRSGWVVEAWPRGTPGRFGARSRFNEELLTVAAVMAEVDLSRCRLVVMAACSTGLPSGHPAGELTGLPAALLAAGAGAVVGALWPVRDAAAAAMMRLFYAHLGDGGADSARALAAARADLRRLERAEAMRLLAREAGVPPGIPPGDRPFDTPDCWLAFQHYGAG
jgi:tetratricopeptide (TPR) repeat protein